MKFSKIILGSAILAMAMGFVSCSDDDDPYNMISGSNNHYSINYTNDTDQIQRGISSTAFKHAGATLKVSFDTVNSTYTGGSESDRAGVMGVIFDLEEAEGKKNFYVIGMRSVGKNETSGKKDNAIEYYISKFENITDLQAVNFGATKTASDGEPKETVVVDTWAKASAWNTDGVDSILVYIAQESGEDLQYDYKVYLLDPSTELDSNGVPTADLSKTTAAATIDVNYPDSTQKKLSVYANVYGNQTLVGNWDYQGTYKQVSLEE